MRKYHPAPDRDDIHWGMLLALVHNQYAEPGHTKSVQDMMPYHDRFEEEITAEELLRRIGV